MANKPNVLFILTDQQRADTLGCYGNSVIQTPNLDALAREGFLFENAYVTQPVCTPSRASIMTGLYPNTHGCITNNIPLGPRTRPSPRWSPANTCAATSGSGTWATR